MTGCLKNSGEPWFEGYNDEKDLVSSVCAHCYQMTPLQATNLEKVHNHQNNFIKLLEIL